MSKKTPLFVTVLLLALLSPANAASLETALRICSAMPADKERLQCFDGLISSTENSNDLTLLVEDSKLPPVADKTEIDRPAVTSKRKRTRKAMELLSPAAK